MAISNTPPPPDPIECLNFSMDPVMGMVIVGLVSALSLMLPARLAKALFGAVSGVVVFVTHELATPPKKLLFQPGGSVGAVTASKFWPK
jgi:hypothetical protein